MTPLLSLTPIDQGETWAFALDSGETVVTMRKATVPSAEAAAELADAFVHILAQGVAIGRQLASEEAQA